MIGLKPHGCSMRIHELAEEAWLDRLTFTDQDLYKILDLYGDKPVMEFACWFLDNIEPQHTIPGRTVFDMREILARHYNKDHTLSNKQRIYLLGRVLAHWSNLTCQGRAKIAL